MTPRDILTPLNIGLVAILAIATAAGFVLVPAGTTLPVHWGITGEADGFLPRDAALLMLPLIALLILALLVGAQRLAGEQRRQASRFAIAAAVPALLALFTAIQVGTVMIGSGVDVDMVRVIVVGVGALFIVLGNVMPKTQPNWIAGIRLPWTLSDPVNWQATHRVGGLLMMVGGAAIVLAAILTGHPMTLLAVTLAGVFLPVVVTTIYSYRLSRQMHRG
jgi:uncharacterized membrane protein